MMLTDKTERLQTESLAFELELNHAPEKVWRALTDPSLLAQWLLPAIGFQLDPGATFTFQAPPLPGWDGIVNCRVVEIEGNRAYLAPILRACTEWVSIEHLVPSREADKAVAHE